MSARQKFEGEVVRVEPNGFGVVRFDHALGANTHGIFSTDLSQFGFAVEQIRTGMHVEGMAEVDEKDLAAIKVLTVACP
jgi:hypothetical protein